MKFLAVVGARPNYMKVAPIMRACHNCRGIKPILVHTGQHYQPNMSGDFFKDLELPNPDYYLGVGSASHAEQTARIMMAFEKVLSEVKPQVVIVVGDVNSTLACSLVAAKTCVPIAHVEAGLRSFDRTMPEEINRVLTDHVSDYLFTTCEDANQNLLREGISKPIHFVGNTMIDSLLQWMPKIDASGILPRVGLSPGEYAVLTLHRPANVDTVEAFERIAANIRELARSVPIVFPVHPRTEPRIKDGTLNIDNVLLLPPLAYVDFMKLLKHCEFVITDSGGIQEETTYLQVPCLTLRPSTERPVTIRSGTNRLVQDVALLPQFVARIRQNGQVRSAVPDLWDGQAARRIVQVLARSLAGPVPPK